MRRSVTPELTTLCRGQWSFVGGAEIQLQAHVSNGQRLTEGQYYEWTEYFASTS